ncbi:hypothetical protein Hanom_Chr12g01168801 [Helianthus anomalus]
MVRGLNLRISCCHIIPNLLIVLLLRNKLPFLLPLVYCSSAKKQVALSHRSTRSTTSPAVASQSFDPISVDSGNEDDANAIASVICLKPVKKETPVVSSEACGVPDQLISVIFKKLNESKRVVPEKYVLVVDEGKKLKTVLKKNPKGGASKTVSPRKGASTFGVEEAASSKVVDEKKKKKKKNVDVVLQDKPEVVKGKRPVKTNFHVLVPR